ncbi:MAG: twin-arginine translocation signal domain-containing protein, partial [Proteobacteria bacterium]|nr:twin-arginine translocation signal domain-containing protein [Pseudomonadota bacterium]NDF10025.1 twin-arginine translocation signal domain-containing protein [Pseudomonadota bacterium]NDG99348.1 twin-arginine translocation signal domain-containing protein [Pseudomonadota bacterium]
MINGELELGRRTPSRRGFLAMAMVGVSGVLAACG